MTRSGIRRLLAPYGCAESIVPSTSAAEDTVTNPSLRNDVMRLVAKVGAVKPPDGDGKGFNLRSAGLRVVRRRSAA